jgi:hypothetical protein
MNRLRQSRGEKLDLLPTMIKAPDKVPELYKPRREETHSAPIAVSGRPVVPRYKWHSANPDPGRTSANCSFMTGWHTLLTHNPPLSIRPRADTSIFLSRLTTALVFYLAKDSFSFYYSFLRIALLLTGTNWLGDSIYSIM